jgi:hypothetical protein
MTAMNLWLTVSAAWLGANVLVVLALRRRARMLGRI